MKNNSREEENNRTPDTVRSVNGKAFREGMEAGIPIGLGYFAVSFALGVAARDAGLNPAQGFIASILCLASAGQYAGFSCIAALSGYAEIALITLVINARYLLMSTAVSQRLDPEMPYRHRFGIAYFITDEIFAVCSTVKGTLKPHFMYGVTIISALGWVTGTFLGAAAGEILTYDRLMPEYMRLAEAEQRLKAVLCSQCLRI